MLCVPALLTAPLAAQQEPERVVRQLDFVGNHAIDDYTLSTVIATSQSSWFARAALVRALGLGAKRYFDELEFRRDVVRLIIYYRQSGYMQVVVDTSVRRTPRDAYITFRIFEGQPVRVRHLDVTGIAGIVNERPLLRAMPLKVGDPFNRFLMQASADTLAAWLRNRGFPFAQVLRNFDAEAAELAADISFEAVPGPFMRVGDIVVDGLRRLDTTTVLRMLSVHPGETYREDLLYRSQRDLYSTGMFRAATVGMRDTVPPQNGDTTVDLVVRVAEGPRQRIGLGAGYGTLDCFRAQGGWSSYGFLGDARVLNLSTRVSKIGVGAPLDMGFSKPGSVCFPLEGDSTSDTLNYNVALTLLQPTFLSPSHSASIGVFAERRSEFKTYTRIQVGANAGVTFNARRRVPLGLVYGYSVGRTEATDAGFCSVFNVCDDSTLRSLRDPHPFASLTLTAALRTEDFTLDPTRGGHVGITLLHASRLLGSDRLYEFNRGEIEVARYIPFGRYGVFAWRLHAGALFPARITVSPGQSALFDRARRRLIGADKTDLVRADLEVGNGRAAGFRLAAPEVDGADAAGPLLRRQPLGDRDAAEDGALAQLGIDLDDGSEEAFAERILQLLLNVAVRAIATIEQRDEDPVAEDGVAVLAHPADDAHHVAQGIDGKEFRLGGHDQQIRCHQRVVRYRAQEWGTINDDVIVWQVLFAKRLYQGRFIPLANRKKTFRQAHFRCRRY